MSSIGGGLIQISRPEKFRNWKYFWKNPPDCRKIKLKY
ncbi:hypothetical protein B4135_2205 [Caldibacillus debilis]|uniref:Uncharacterized protein n=1 Tax=Caldibacillus debilis TaxID=301148 RepID=A0A150M2B6_9BACI|nr:hypothetical protein B4135_2205 [Caldibacillus debilis]